MEQKVSNRIKILDFYRGAAMLLVLLQHSGIYFGKLILAFHMPFFFLLSGYIYRKKRKCRKYFFAGTD